MTQAPAGWYPDPAPRQPGQPPTLRYWDGRLWTEHVHQPASLAGWPPHAEPGPAPGPTTPDGVPLSGWWRRVGAYIIDSLLVGVVTLLVTLRQQLRLQEDLNELMRRFQDEGERSSEPPDLGAFFRDYFDIALPIIILSGITGFVGWAVYSLVMLRFKGATVGKMAVGIAVRLRERPGQLPWSTILVRVLTQHGVLLTALVPILYLALIWFPYLDGLWASWDNKKQTLHDKVARTNVVLVR